MSLGEHKQVLTHKTRYIVNTTLNVQKIHKETSVKPEQWLKWFKTNNSVNTFVDNRSYADIVKTVHSCVNSKLIKLDILQRQSTPVNVMQGNKYNALNQNAFAANALGPNQPVLLYSLRSNAILSLKANSPIKKVIFNWPISLLFCNHYRMMQMMIHQMAHILLTHWKAIKTKRGKHWVWSQ